MQACGQAGGTVIGILAADLLRSTVNRQNRQGIQSGQLVLISPFNPEAGFNAGSAMARNRYIYALADFAVVVDSAEGEPINTAPLDLFPVFLQRLIVFLGSATRTEEEIRFALGLERSQVKVWLAAAVSGGHVEKLKKPVVYALLKQKSLC